MEELLINSSLSPELCSRFIRISRLQDGWDGPETKPPSKEIIIACMLIVEELLEEYGEPNIGACDEGMDINYDDHNAFGYIDDHQFEIFKYEKGKAAECTEVTIEFEERDRVVKIVADCFRKLINGSQE